jgi:type II secretory pathway pseudopilin PulG
MSTGAVIAIVLAIVLVGGVAVVGVVAAIAIPSLIRARAAANESSAIGSLRTIGSAEATYHSRHDTFVDLNTLGSADMLGPEWRDGMERNSYRFTCVRADSDGFEIHAEPLPDTQTAGDRSYTITEDYTIRYADGPSAPPGTTGRVLGAG